MTVPPPPINPIITIQPLTAVGVAHDTDASGALAGTKHGDVIQGFVVNRDGNQNPILRTPLGDILVKSDIFLKTGSEVQIRVDVQLASRARIIMIDGYPPETYVKLNAQVQQPRADVILQSSILSQQRVAAPQSANTSGNTDAELPTLTAVVLRQDNAGIKELLGLPPRASQPQMPTTTTQTPQPTSTQSPTARMPAGTQVQVTIIAGSLPAAIPSSGSDTIAQLLAPSLAVQAVAPQVPPTQAAMPPAAQPQAPNQPAAQTAPQTPQAAITIPSSQTPQGLPAAATNSPAITPNQIPAAPAAQPNLSPQPQIPAAATSNLNAQDVHALLQAASSPPQTRAQQLPPMLQHPALAAQTLGQEDAPAHHTPLQQLPSSYRPFAGTHVIQQPAPSAQSLAQQPQQTPFLGVAHIPKAPASITAGVPNAPAPASTGAAQPAPTRGEPMQVIGHEPDGGTIVKGEHTTLKLFTAKPLPTGTTLIIDVTRPAVLPNPLAASLPARLVEFSNLASHWPALEDALSTLAQTTAAGQQPVPANALIPTIGPRFSHDVLLFLSVVRGGDFSKLWPTQVIKQLEEARPELLQRLQLDMGNMQQLAQPAQPQQQWSVYLIPMLFGNEAQHMRLFVRSDDSDKNKEGSVHNQRFIMEVALSNLGDMQLDGFVQGGKRPSQFDLVIRTAKTLPDAVEADISRLFNGALESTRLKGRIVFQTGREHFITPATQIGPTGNHQDGDFTLLA